MSTPISENDIRQMASRWVPSIKDTQKLTIHKDTTDFFQVEYGDILYIDNTPYLIRQNAKEGRFGLDDEVKHWVKLAINLRDGTRKVIKLVFHEKFTAHIGGIAFDCFRSPKKEARILDLVANNEHFMHGYWVLDHNNNVVRILDFIYGPPLSKYIQNISSDHESYFYEQFPTVLNHFIKCVQAIGFLHEHGEKHGDIRRDHILLDRETETYRWIDFDFNYRHRENIYGYDLFGLGNILAFLVGKGDVTLQNLSQQDDAVLNHLREEDLNIVFHHRVVNLMKVYPYIPTALNHILLHFSLGANRFYETTNQFLEDLRSIEIT